VLTKRFPLITEVLLFLFSLSLSMAWLYFEIGFPFTQFLLTTSRMKPDSGQAYIAILPRPPLRTFVKIETGSMDAPESSSTNLYEDGHRLGPSHSLPDDIRKNGQGAFSRQGRQLLFSSSDGSSPLTNRRTYLVRAPLAPTVLFRFVGIIGSIVFLWRLFVLLSLRAREAVLVSIRRTGRWLITPVELGGNWTASAIIALAVVGASWYYLINLWGSGKTVSFAVSGFFQVSDASGYAMCANQMLDASSEKAVAGYFGGWCLRRPIYPAFLATILAITDRNWLWTLLIQSSLVALSIVVLLRATVRLAGHVIALLVLWLLFSFSIQNVFPTTTTESVGLALGAVGLTLLLDTAELANPLPLFLGTACLSVALNARAGAFLALPFLLAAILFQPMPARSKILSAAIAIAGIACGFAAQLFLIAYFGGASSASHGNFSYTLYGLSVGGKGWSQIFIDHPEIFPGNQSDAEVARRIFDLAWRNIISSPTVIAKAFLRNLNDFFHDPLVGVTDFRFFPIALWWLGGLSTALHWREFRYRVIGLMSLGVVLSSPIIIQDGGARLFAATWGITAVQAGLGLHLLLSPFGKVLDRSYSSADFPRFRSHFFETGLAIFLLAAIFLPLTPVQRLVSLNAVPPQGCAKDEKELVARLGRESYMIALLGEKESKNPWQMQVSADDARRGMRGAWFEKGFAELSVPATLIHGYQIMATEGKSGVGDDIRLVWYGDLGKLSGKTVSFCFRPDITVPVTDATYYLARAVRPLKP
jgi:hypothetical protein